MKILYLGSFIRSHSTERYVTEALRRAGVEVVTRLVRGGAPSLKYCLHRLDEGVDVVLFSKPSATCFNRLMKECRRRGVLTVTWLWDLYWGYRPERPIQLKADLLFTTDGGHDRNWREHGANHSVLRQGIHAPEAVVRPPNPIHDVGFVGSRSTYRHRGRLLGWLRRRYGDRFIHHQSVRGLDLNEALSKIKVVVGDSYPSPRYWSNRIYEVIGRGGFLLHPQVEGLEEEFRDGEHYVSFPHGPSGLGSLARLIDYWAHPDQDEERERIRQAGAAHVRQSLTYDHRVAELLSQVYRALGREAPTGNSLAAPP